MRHACYVCYVRYTRFACYTRYTFIYVTYSARRLVSQASHRPSGCHVTVQSSPSVAPPPRVCLSLTSARLR